MGDATPTSCQQHSRGSPSVRFIYKRPVEHDFFLSIAFLSRPRRRTDRATGRRHGRMFIPARDRFLSLSLSPLFLSLFSLLSFPLSLSLSLSSLVSARSRVSLVQYGTARRHRRHYPATTTTTADTADAGRFSFRWNIDSVRRPNDGVRSNNAHELWATALHYYVVTWLSELSGAYVIWLLTGAFPERKSAANAGPFRSRCVHRAFTKLIRLLSSFLVESGGRIIKRVIIQIYTRARFLWRLRSSDLYMSDQHSYEMSD